MEDPTDEQARMMVKMYDDYAIQDLNRENDPDWAKDNLEYDLRSTDWILEKARDGTIYAQNLYAAICNNTFIKNDVWPILKDQRWSCSWRHAGGIVADMRQEGDYVEWYCSGITHDAEMDSAAFDSMSPEHQTLYKESRAYVNEGLVTDEIKEDLFKLGWLVETDD